MERAERDAENRGVKIERTDDDGNGRKRRRMGDGMGLVKGEAAFLNNAREAGVDVVRAPRGMSRAKENLSKWFPKYVSRLLVWLGMGVLTDWYRQKCLNWTVEWIRPGPEKVSRNFLESSSIANAYDRAFPPPKEESTARVQLQVQGQLQGQESTQVEFENIQETTPTMPGSTATTSQQKPDSTTQPPLPPNSEPQPETETTQHNPLAETKPETGSTPSHRDIYFYLHRPRTATRQPVLIPLSPSTTLTDALRGHTVLEFPTIYVLPDSPEVLLTEKREQFLLEEDYLRTEKPALEREAGEMLPGEDGVEDTASGPANRVDLGQVDEKRVLEVLKQDLFGAGHQATS